MTDLQSESSDTPDISYTEESDIFNLIFTAASTIKYDRPRLRICYKTISLPNIKKCQTFFFLPLESYQNDHDNISQTDPDMSILSIFFHIHNPVIK